MTQFCAEPRSHLSRFSSREGQPRRGRWEKQGTWGPTSRPRGASAPWGSPAAGTAGLSRYRGTLRKTSTLIQAAQLSSDQGAAARGSLTAGWGPWDTALATGSRHSESRLVPPAGFRANNRLSPGHAPDAIKPTTLTAQGMRGGLRRPHASSQRRHFSSGEETRSQGGGAGGCSSRETLRGEDGGERGPAAPLPGHTAGVGAVPAPTSRGTRRGADGGRKVKGQKGKRQARSPEPWGEGQTRRERALRPVRCHWVAGRKNSTTTGGSQRKVSS